MTVVQSANFVLWFFHAKYQFMPLGVAFAMMIFTGLIGGAMYVNTFASLVDDKDIREKDREISINVVALWVNLGIVSSAVFEILSANTFLPNKIAA